MQQAGAAVGDADRVEVLEHPRRVAVVLRAERDRHPGIAIGGEHFEPARRLRGEGPHVGVPADLITLVQQVPDRRGRLQPNLVRQRAAVGVGVDGYHPVAAQRGERRAKSHRGRRLAYAALEAQTSELYTQRRSIVVDVGFVHLRYISITLLYLLR